MQQELNFAIDLARQAGNLIKTNFSKNLTIEIKADNSPVTQVDKQINSVVADAIKKAYPTHGLLGEEGNVGTGHEEFQWLCDPLDGTRAFIFGLPESMFLLALLQNGQPLIAVAFDPFLNNMFHAVKGAGAFCNGKKIKVSSATISEGATLMDNASLHTLAALKIAGGSLKQVSSTGTKCMLVATGKAVGFIHHEADHHDIGPSSLIIEEAGGRATDLNGHDLNFDKSISGVVLSNAASHESLLKIANT